MLHLVSNNRTYSPESIALMTNAFDRASEAISERAKGKKDVKQSLALIILRHFDQGVHDAEGLADVALREWTGGDRATV